MSAYVGKLLTSISSALEFNTATLSGAIDIIVIEDDSGKRRCSPFHVRYGKLQLLKSRGIPVDVELNGSPTNLRMLLGAAGEAYFYRPGQAEANHECQNATHSILAESSPVSIASTSTDSRASPALDENANVCSSPKRLAEDTSRNSERGIQTSEATLLTYLQDDRTSRLASDYSFAYMSDSEVELTRNERDGTSEVVDEPRSPPINSYQRKWNSVVVHNCDAAQHSEIQVTTPTGTESSPETPSAPETTSPHSSDQEIHSKGESQTGASSSTRRDVEELNRTKGSGEEECVGESMMFPDILADIDGEEDAKMECRSVDEQGDDSRFEELQQRVAGMLSEAPLSSDRESSVGLGPKKRTRDSNGNNVTSLQKSFLDKLRLRLQEKTDASTREEVLGMSLCSPLLSSDMKEDEILELFEHHRVSFTEFEKNPRVLFDPALVVKIENRLVEFRVAAAFIFSLLSFRGEVDIDSLAALLAKEQKDEPVKSPPTPLRRFRWFGWSSPAIEGEPLLEQDDLDILDAIPSSFSQADSKDQIKPDMIPSPESGEEQYSQEEVEDEEKETTLISAQGDLSQESSATLVGFDSAAIEGDQMNLDLDSKPSLGICFSDIDPNALSLYPSEEDLAQLDLKPGANAVRFIVQSSSVELSCRIFLWGCHSKIFVSDVDGTITRSDVLGHLLPAVGRDWSQVGVAGLYTQIEKNGYKVLYLTARPIGQASQTRSFLHNVTQGSAKLPNGPVLMSPNRLVESFTREVIHRKPHEFKITALREIRGLFPPYYNPFHAGFGNRDSDVISYRAVGLIPQRIFVVNPKGELVVTKARYESTASYSTLKDLVESVFPDISRQSGLDKIQAVTESASFNDWNFWKATLPDVDIDSLLHNGTGA